MSIGGGKDQIPSASDCSEAVPVPFHPVLPRLGEEAGS